MESELSHVFLSFLFIFLNFHQEKSVFFLVWLMHLFFSMCMPEKSPLLREENSVMKDRGRLELSRTEVCLWLARGGWAWSSGPTWFPKSQCCPSDQSTPHPSANTQPMSSACHTGLAGPLRSKGDRKVSTYV